MATGFPTSLDAFPSAATLSGGTLGTVPHSTLHGNLGDALAAVQSKIGINGSNDTNSLQYKLSQALASCGRLTLTSGTAVTTGDVTGATSIYFSPHRGNLMSLYDGSSVWNPIGFNETSLALGTLTSGLPYDVFAYNNNGTLALDPPLAWSSGTARATALTLQNGVLVKSGATTRRYLGSFYTTSTTATEDSAAKRFVWNYYNRVPRHLELILAGTNHAYSTANYRYWNNDSASRFEFLIGVLEDKVVATGNANAGTAGANASIAFGLDANVPTIPNGLIGTYAATVTFQNSICCNYEGYPAVGYHYLALLEWASGSITWYDKDTFSGDRYTQSGIYGTVWG